MGRRSPSARPHHLLPLTVALLAALGWTGLRARRAADARAANRPPAARPSPDSAYSPPAHPQKPARTGAQALRFEPEVVDLGRLEPGGLRVVPVAWQVEDASPRVALGVDATCGCVVAEGLPRHLAPGDRGTLRLVVRSPRRPGPFHAVVKVWLHPASCARPPTLLVRGHVLSRVGVRPAALALGARTAGASVVRRLEIDVVPALAAAPVEAALEGLDGEVAVEPPAFAGRAGATLRLGARVPVTPGPFAGRIVVRVGEEPGELEVPVTGEVVLSR